MEANNGTVAERAGDFCVTEEDLEQALQSARTTKSILIGVHITPRLAAAIDRYIVAEQEEIKRTEAIRRLLKQCLTANGLYR